MFSKKKEMTRAEVEASIHKQRLSHEVEGKIKI